MSWLNLNGIHFSREELIVGSFGENHTPFEDSVLRFCHGWLGGKQEFLLQTSGSTGAPKKITIKRNQMEASARMTIRALNLKSGYNALVCLDTKYIAGQMMLVRSLVNGMNIIAVEPTSNPFANFPKSERVDFAAFVPYQIETILHSGERARLDDLKCAIIGGAPLELSTRNELPSVKCRLYLTYGMTETISHVALQRLNGDQIQNYFEVLDGIVISQDERGCLILTVAYLANKKIITNDLVEIIDENKFLWVGRWDNIINSGGVKVIPEKVERAIQEIFTSLGITNRFFVWGEPDIKLTQKVTLIIEGNSFEVDLANKIKIMLDEKISRFERPKEFKFVSRFKETETGKVLRAETLNLVPASSQ